MRKALQEGGAGRVKGLLILAEEGINGSFCARPSDAEDYKRLIESLFQKQRGDFFYKDSFCSEWSFRRLSVKVKREIVTMNHPFPFQTESSPGKLAGLRSAATPSAPSAEKTSRAEKNFGKKFPAEKASCEAVADNVMSDNSKKSPPSVPAESSPAEIRSAASAEADKASAAKLLGENPAAQKAAFRGAPGGNPVAGRAATSRRSAGQASLAGQARSGSAQNESVQSGFEGIHASAAASLTPEEWDKKLKKGGAQILDVRNNYETETGKFKGAASMNIQHFKTFPDKLKEALSTGFEGGMKLNPKKETLIYCTGGVRCEKAALAMRDLGFQKVFQLQGGILNYLKNRPRRLSYFERECFVFDHRAAVDENLNPSAQYRLCPHCGQPGREKITCSRCGTEKSVCRRCLNKAPHYQTCSKNCAYHFKKGHRFKAGRKKTGS